MIQILFFYLKKTNNKKIKNHVNWLSFWKGEKMRQVKAWSSWRIRGQLYYYSHVSRSPYIISKFKVLFPREYNTRLRWSQWNFSTINFLVLVKNKCNCLHEMIYKFCNYSLNFEKINILIVFSFRRLQTLLILKTIFFGGNKQIFLDWKVQ